MQLITNAAVSSTSSIRRVLDNGCGAGNNTIMLRQVLGSNFDSDLLDLSVPMLDRAADRVAAANTGTVSTINADFRDAPLAAGAYDIILAAAVLHHLRDDNDWRNTFQKIYDILTPGGSVWITDLVSHETASVHAMMWDRYGDYLTLLGGDEYRNKVFDYIDKEDSPRPSRINWISCDRLASNTSNCCTKIPVLLRLEQSKTSSQCRLCRKLRLSKQ